MLGTERWQLFIKARAKSLTCTRSHATSIISPTNSVPFKSLLTTGRIEPKALDVVDWETRCNMEGHVFTPVVRKGH